MTYAWNSAMDRNRATVSFDFQKAFDLVDRGICIGSKALPFDIHEATISWIILTSCVVKSSR